MAVSAMTGHGSVVGALILLRTAAFTADEEDFAGLFAAAGGTALSAARLSAEKDSITDMLARELAPPRLRRLDGAELATGRLLSSSGDKVGGDFYDVLPPADGGEWLVALGDVCGSDLEAALVTGRLRAALRVLRPLAGDHQKVLGLLNDLLLAGPGGDRDPRFATLVLASLRRHGEDVRLRLTAAGHPPPLIVRTDGRVERVASRGNLIGGLDRVGSRTAAAVLRPGDTCLLYTDGITEARDAHAGREMFGEHRLHRALASCAGLPCEAVVERVQMLASRWVGGGPHDDMAVVAIGAPRHEP
ncbi:PP2C family protein-serine/threonine phosphatase [Actinomadura fibrosa]|uniref:PP2C family protein-serine/threonine phosphatase n=1 Tax=Actinomadura fibrosa TaxID=111802 RepID=A0ABW2XIK8_9ACTN|nr:PP2C family protein-serine/threonine phosphatase [Actinomadura fibrosa]